MQEYVETGTLGIILFGAPSARVSGEECLPTLVNLGEQTKTANAVTAIAAKRTITTSGLEDTAAVPFAVDSAGAVENAATDRAPDGSPWAPIVARTPGCPLFADGLQWILNCYSGERRASRPVPALLWDTGAGQTG